jgi:hypothetical protein
MGLEEAVHGYADSEHGDRDEENEGATHNGPPI